MKELIAFSHAFSYAQRNGLAITIDYGDFGDPDGWDWITIIPETTTFNVSNIGININGQFIPWDITDGAFECCPIISEGHTGVAVKIFTINDEYETKN